MDGQDAQDEGGESWCSAAVREGTQPLVQSDEELWHGVRGRGAARCYLAERLARRGAAVVVALDVDLVVVLALAGAALLAGLDVGLDAAAAAGLREGWVRLLVAGVAADAGAGVAAAAWVRVGSRPAVRARRSSVLRASKGGPEGESPLGVSRMAGSAPSSGWRRMTAQASRLMVPRVMWAWRSLRLAAGASESLRWRQRILARPKAASIWVMMAAVLAALSRA